MLDLSLENFKKVESEKKEYTPIKKGVYVAELLDIEAKNEETYNSKQGKTDKKEYELQLSYQFVLLNGKDEKGNSYRGRSVWHNFGKSILYISYKTGEKNDLYKIVEAFLGRNLTIKEEAEGISPKLLNSFISKKIQISVDQTIKKDKIYNKINDFNFNEFEIDGLSQDEKEKSRVKKDKNENEEIKEEFPTIQIDEYDPIAEGMQKFEEEEEIKIEEVPF